MTVKKTLSLKRPKSSAAATAAPATGEAGGEAAAPAAAPTGGATIADRFKLDASEGAKPSGGAVGIGTKIAVIAALIALVAAGVLTYTLYGHWEFLKGA